jgi:hypothetical protein
MKILVIAGLLFASTAHAETVAVSAADCKKLVAHTPNDDVTYKPGVDVRGKKVAPADLDGGYQMELPESIDLQIGVDLADRLALRDARKQAQSGSAPTTRKVLPAEGYAPVGTLSIRGNEAYWNGKLLASQDQAALTLACRQGLTEAAKK